MRLSDFAIRTLAAIGAIAFLVAAAIHVSTFFQVNGDYLTVAVLILVAPMVMVFGGAILALNSRRRIVVPSAGPGLALALGVLALFVYAGINFFTTRLFGQPEATGGAYFLNAHGFRVPIDRQQYEEAVRLQVRLLSGHVLLFIGIGAALLVATLSQSVLTASARPVLALDLERRRMDVTPRARIYLGMFGVSLSARCGLLAAFRFGPGRCAAGLGHRRCRDHPLQRRPVLAVDYARPSG